MTISYDAGDLGRAARDLVDAVAGARAVADEAGRLAGLVDDWGHGSLASAAPAFLAAWGYGAGLVADDAEGLAGALQQAVGEYAAIDAAGAAALRSGG